MRTDGSQERLLTASFLDEGPTWAPNGRVIMFTREVAGGNPSLYSVDISGRNLRRLPTETAASDPAWSPLCLEAHAAFVSKPLKPCYRAAIEPATDPVKDTPRCPDFSPYSS
jgi:hypothetical protein